MERTEAATVWQARAEFLAGQLEAARDARTLSLVASGDGRRGQTFGRIRGWRD